MKIVTLIFIVFIFFACGTTEPPNIVNYHNKILYTSMQTGKEQLYMMDPDGTNIKQITNGEYSHSAGKWSPDASMIAAKTDESFTTAGSHIVTMNSDGSNRKLLPILAWSDLAWSPDGQRIAFSFMPSAEIGDLSSYIFVVNYDGTGLTRLTEIRELNETIPTWSKDGNTIYFASNRHNSLKMNPEIYSVNVINKKTTRITTTPDGYSTSPSISKKGEKVAIVSTRGIEPFSGIFIMNLDGSNVEIIIKEIKNEIFNFPNWSPDGKKLVCVSAFTDDSQKTFVNIVDIDKKEIKRIVDDQTANFPDWSW